MQRKKLEALEKEISYKEFGQSSFLRDREKVAVMAEKIGIAVSSLPLAEVQKFYKLVKEASHRQFKAIFPDFDF